MTAGLPIRPPDLDHRHVHRPQETGQPSPVGTGALDTDAAQRAERTQPLVQLTEPSGCRRERLDAKHPAIGVNRRGDMSVEVSVYPASDLTRLYDGHRHPFSLQSWLRGGTHVPGRRP